ncbi:MAG: nitrilase-related carbon-nitrogen hydrolase [Dehalococcoidia bacterium]
MSRPLTVALLQTVVTDTDDLDHASAEQLHRIDEAAAEQPRLIVVPEATRPTSDAAGRSADAVSGLAERARRHRCWIAAGVAVPGADGTPRRALVLLSPDGSEQARAVESAGDAASAAGGAVAATLDETTVGLLAGEDVRDAEQVARLAEADARLLISTCSSAAWGRRPERLPEPESHIFLAARAMEAGAWAVTAGRVGMEASSRLYAGHSGVVSPRGAWVVRAPSDRPGVVLHTVDLDATPGAWTGMPAPNEDTGATIPPATSVPEPLRVAALALDPLPSAVELMQQLRSIAEATAAQGANVMVLPDLAGLDARAVTSAESLPLLQSLSRALRVVLAVTLADRDDGTTYKTAYMVDDGEVRAAHRQTRLDEAERAAGFTPGVTPPPIVPTSAGNIALLSGYEGATPALARGLRARGASLIAWCAGGLGPAVEAVARTRATEQRLPVAAAGTATGGGGLLVSGAGAVLAVTVDGHAMSAHGVLTRAMRG